MPPSFALFGVPSSAISAASNLLQALTDSDAGVYEATEQASGRAVVIETLDPGEIVGWSWLFPPYRWHFDARALSLVRATSFDGACLRGKCDDDTDLGSIRWKRGAGLRIGRAVDHTLETRMQQGHRAHRAGLQRDVELAIRQAVVFEQ